MKRFFRAFVRGLASLLGSLAGPFDPGPPYEYPYKTDADAMRADFNAILSDMRKSVSVQHERRKEFDE